MVKLTKTVIDRTPCPATGQTFLRDSQLKGFALRITAGGSKTFIIEKRIEGRVRRLSLGRYGELTCEQARRLAASKLGQLAMGVNIIAERERARLEGVTLDQAYEDFKRARKNLRPKTLYDYDLMMRAAFADWRRRPMRRITKDMVAKRHRELGETRGEATANGAMRILRALFNFAMAEYEDSFGHAMMLENPVKRLNQTRAWYRTVRRRSVIKVHQLPAWFKGIELLRAEGNDTAITVADYLKFMLMTGLRRGEAAMLTWDRVDLIEQSVFFPDPKNHEPFLLPLSDHLVTLLERRKAYALNGYVFPGTGRHGYLIEPKRQIAKVIEASGVHFTPHDLRRTFITVAEALDVPPYAIKRLVNHKMRNDVTAGYIVSDLERLRAPMQRVTDFFVRKSWEAPAGVAAPARPTQAPRPAAHALGSD